MIANRLGVDLRLKLFLFGIYSFLENLIYKLLEFLPHPLRFLVFKVVLRELGSHSMIDYHTYIRYPWKIRIGSHVSINRGCEFFGAMIARGASISIGNYCALAPHVRILGATHDYKRLDLPDQARSVSIGNYVWVGAGATILPGVTIGDGAVVAAGSVVTKDVERFTIVAGNPARFIRLRELDDDYPLQ